MLAFVVLPNKPSLHSYLIYFTATSLLLRYETKWERNEYVICHSTLLIRKLGFQALHSKYIMLPHIKLYRLQSIAFMLYRNIPTYYSTPNMCFG
jgi:hypothetical protein